MRCPYCRYEQSKVVDSRASEEGRSVRRRRECLSCSQRFTTYERIESTPLMVVKRDGRRERFQREKILDGIMTACEKRPVAVDKLQQLVDDIEYKLVADTAGEVRSEVIGKLVMERLQELDDVAYVRFASVYRQFKDLDAFEEELAKLKREERDAERGQSTR